MERAKLLRGEGDRSDPKWGYKAGNSMSYNRASIEILACSKNIGFARVAVASFASQLDFTLGELEEIKVAVSEGVSNAIIHAYDEEQEGSLSLAITIEGSLLRIEIRDYGRGLENIEDAFEPSFTTADRMGLGLLFIESFMDSVSIKNPPGGGVCLIMEKTPQLLKEKVCEEDGDGGS